jgi:hypothetical protein
MSEGEKSLARELDGVCGLFLLFRWVCVVLMPEIIIDE